MKEGITFSMIAGTWKREVDAGEPKMDMEDEAKGAARMMWSYGGISGPDADPAVERTHFGEGDEVVLGILRRPVTWRRKSR